MTIVMNSEEAKVMSREGSSRSCLVLNNGSELVLSVTRCMVVSLPGTRGLSKERRSGTSQPLKQSLGWLAANHISAR
jgi:hypothetical protein